MAQYLVGLDSSLKRLYVWKTTGDPTTLGNWSAQDRGVTLMSRVYSMWAVLDGTDIHIATYGIDRSDTDTIEKVEYHKFDTSTDTWSIIREKAGMNTACDSTDVQDAGVSIGVRSDGDVIILFTNNPNDAGQETAYSRREGGTWTKEVSVESAFNEGAGSVVRGASDRMHFFYTGTISGLNLRHRSLSSGNVLDTSQAVDTSGVLINFSVGRGISYVSGADTVVKFPHINSGEFITASRFDSGANPTITKDISISDNKVEDLNNSVIACFAVDGTDTWLLYSGGGVSGVDQDIYSDTQSDGGSWGTDTEEQDAVTANRISAGVYERSGTRLGYVWLDGTTTAFDEIALLVPFIAEEPLIVGQAINRASTY